MSLTEIEDAATKLANSRNIDVVAEFFTQVITKDPTCEKELKRLIPVVNICDYRKFKRKENSYIRKIRQREVCEAEHSRSPFHPRPLDHRLSIKLLEAQANLKLYEPCDKCLSCVYSNVAVTKTYYLDKNKSLTIKTNKRARKAQLRAATNGLVKANLDSFISVISDFINN